MDLHLSIIIPIYNLELYIEKCLKSILNQDLPVNQYEIIVINDGSTDNSASIVSRLIKNNSNIKLINKTNGGVSSARNVGIQEAKGEYITFLDGDDYFVPNILSSILNYVKKDDLQIGLFGIRGEDSKIENFYLKSTSIITGIDLYLNHRKYIGDNSRAGTDQASGIGSCVRHTAAHQSNVAENGCLNPCYTVVRVSPNSPILTRKQTGAFHHEAIDGVAQAVEVAFKGLYAV